MPLPNFETWIQYLYVVFETLHFISIPRLPFRTEQAFIISLTIIIPKRVKVLRRQDRFFFCTTDLEIHEPFLRFTTNVQSCKSLNIEQAVYSKFEVVRQCIRLLQCYVSLLCKKYRMCSNSSLSGQMSIINWLADLPN